MNIGIVVDNDLNSDKRVLNEIKILKGTGNGIFVLCFGFHSKNYNKIEDINVSRIKINRRIKDALFFFFNIIPLYEWLWACKIRNFIVHNDINVLHVHDLYMSKAGYLGIKGSGKQIPMILDLHENYPYAITTYNWTKGFLRKMITRPSHWKNKEGKYLGYAAKIIVLSDYFRDSLLDQYTKLQKKDFVILPNVPDITQENTDTRDEKPVDKEKDKVTILYFGVIAERRGIFEVLRVIGEIKTTTPRIQFLLIGPIDRKDRQRFYKMIHSESLKDQVRYIPWIDISELPAYLRASEICIAPFHKNPQHESGVANKIFDYMLGQKPIIGSDCRPQKNLIEKCQCGLIYSNLDELKEAVFKLAGDPQLRNIMGERGRKAVLDNYNLRVQGQALVDAYSQLK